jgi:hypothetical protein
MDYECILQMQPPYPSSAILDSRQWLWMSVDSAEQPLFHKEHNIHIYER